MNILFLSIAIGNIEKNDGIYANLVNEFSLQGHNVCVVAANYEINKTKISTVNGIRYISVKTDKFTGVSNVKKGVAYLKIIFQFTYNICYYFSKVKFDCIISHSLPPEIGVISKILKYKYACPYYLIQADYTWQDAVSLGFFREKSLPCRYYKFLERLSFNVADIIAVPTNGNIKFIKDSYNSKYDSKVKLLYFWQKNISLQNIDYSIKRGLSLGDKFVVIYGGSIGIAQDIDSLISLAKNCIEYENIVFLLSVRGANIEVLKKQVEKEKITNVIFIDFLPPNDYIQLLASCDLGMVVLNKLLATPNFPSKTMSYFNLQIPILAAIDYVTDYGEFLETTGTGLWAYSDNIEGLKAKLLLLYESSKIREEIKKNQALFYKVYMLPSYACETIIKQLQEL